MSGLRAGGVSVEYFAKYWLEWALGGIAGAIAALFAWARVKFRSAHKDYQGMRTGTLALLHDRLYQTCRYYIKQGHIDIDALDNIIELYKGYHAMGGNGTGTALYEKILKLPIWEE